MTLLERATSIPITNDINVAIFKEHFSGLINDYISCMECKCKITYTLTKHEIIVNMWSNIHLAIKHSLNTKISKICAKCKQSKSQIKANIFKSSQIIMIIINRFDNNNIKLNNVKCIRESISIDSYQTNLKSFIQHYEPTQNRDYTSVIKKGNTWYHCNDNKTKESNLNQEINYAYIPFYKL